MPIDTRRIQGPENSVDYRAYIKKAKCSSKPTGRSDGRAKSEHRKVFLKTGVITQAKGSAYIEQGRTKVMVGVYGPREIARRSDFSMKGLLTCEFKFAPFACITRRAHQADKEEKELGLVLKEALMSTVCLHLFPKACVDVFVTVIEDDGSVLAASLTAAGVALADAGIEMFDTVIGSAVVLEGDDVVVDQVSEEEYNPVQGSEEEDQRVKGNLTVGYLNGLEQVVAMVCEGELTPELMSRGMSTAINQAQIVLPAVQQCLIESLNKKKKLASQQ